MEGRSNHGVHSVATSFSESWQLHRPSVLTKDSERGGVEERRGEGEVGEELRGR